MNKYSVIRICPHCGKWLPKPLNDGIATCYNCERIFDSSELNKTLSASWAVRQRHLTDASFVKDEFDLSDEQTDYIQHFVIDQLFSHDDLIKLISNNLVLK